jgi:hypothetical protein
MLKKPASGVLASFRSSTYPRGYACGAFFGCGLADGFLDHPAGSRVLVSNRNKLCDDPNN